MFRRKVPNHYIPIHPDNISKKDWIIVLEAGTIVGPSPDKLRVAMATLERKIVKKYNVLLRRRHYLVVDGYDPRIHALYFCPQLYKSNSDGKLVALEGEEIGNLLAKLVQGAVAQKQPWYDPAQKSPNKPIISADLISDLDSVVVDELTATRPLQIEFSREPAAQKDTPELAAPSDPSNTTSATDRPQNRPKR
jgi:hypothetical protein